MQRMNTSMHKATCDKCNKKCEVPFKPSGSKPIFCRDCFQSQGGGDDRSRGSDKYSDRRSGGRSDDRRSDRQSFKATCDECGSKCEVPFRPSGDKPIFCEKCFGGKRGSSSSRGGSDQYEKQFEMVNTKLDKILKMITPTVTVDLKEKKTKELKNLGLARRPGTAEGTEELRDLTFVGFFGLRDPVRPDAKETIEKARAAGVRTVVITGDHPDTAIAVAKEVGIISNHESTMVGSELDKLSDEELAQRVVDINVYARVEPAHKVRIVQAWRARGEVVSMTGDGVNDAPALKAADIGVAQGNGTEVTKSIADMVLINSALTTIVAAIEQGRVIFDNIRKVTVYLLVDSFTEIVLIGSAVLMGLPLPLLPAHILWINLITDGFPSVALTLEPGEPDVMKEPPRPRKEPILNREMKVLIFLVGIITDIGLLAIFLWLLGAHEIEYVRTIIFTAIAIDSLLYVFAVKSFRHSIFHINPFSNKWLVGGVIAGFLLQVLAVTHPFFQHIFELVPLHLNDWLLLLAIACVKLIAIEVAKWFFIVKQYRYAKKEKYQHLS